MALGRRKRLRVTALIAIAVALAVDHTLAQATTNAPVSTVTNTPPVLVNEVDEKAWRFSASVYTYIVPDDRVYLQPTFTVDRGWLHLEARYNYESLDAASAWIGYNLSIGEKLKWDFTPMIGAIFGSAGGVAPGYKSLLSWWKLELYSEGEYVFDTSGTSDNFFFTWSELTLTPAEWLRFGMVIQRTKLYKTDFDIQRGFLIGFSYKRMNFTGYVFNPDASRPTVVLAVGLGY